MANHAMSDEEAQLKRKARRRLIGAVTLVTVMVVVLPMVLDGESRQSGQDIVINIPSPGSNGDFAPAAPVSVQPASVPVEQLSADKAVQEPAAASKVAQTETVVPVAKIDEPAKTPAPAEKVEVTREAVAPSKNKEEKPAAAAHKQDNVPYEIQLGAFANMANAKERQSKLTALKIKFHTETIKTPGGDKLRVRAGPYSTRQEAERVQAKLKAGGILDGVVSEKK